MNTDDLNAVGFDPVWVFYKGYFTEIAARDFADTLSLSNIDYKLEQPKNYGEKIILGNVHHFPYLIKIKQEDFVKIPDAVRYALGKQPESYFHDHPLNQLSAAELYNTFETFNGENHEEFFTALRILELRGVKIDDGKINSTLYKNTLPSVKPIEIDTTKIYITFICLVVGAFISWLVILICVIILLNNMYHTRYDAKGRKMLSYDDKSRKLSRILLIIGLFLNCISIYFMTQKNILYLFKFLNTPYLSN